MDMKEITVLRKSHKNEVNRKLNNEDKNHSKVYKLLLFTINTWVGSTYQIN